METLLIFLFSLIMIVMIGFGVLAYWYFWWIYDDLAEIKEILRKIERIDTMKKNKTGRMTSPPSAYFQNAPPQQTEMFSDEILPPPPELSIRLAEEEVAGPRHRGVYCSKHQVGKGQCDCAIDSESEASIAKSKVERTTKEDSLQCCPRDTDLDGECPWHPRKYNSMRQKQ
jgi:hypothetical protein